MNKAVRDYAKEWIRFYVLRGDSVELVCEGGMSRFCSDNHAQIGGIHWDGSRSRRVPSHSVAITTAACGSIERDDKLRKGG